MRLQLTLLLCIITISAYTQSRNSVWIFGDSAGVNFSDTLNPFPVFSSMDGRGSCASISDTAGNLLFYCYSTWNDSGTFVFTHLNDTMTNGTKLCGAFQFNQMTIIPKPLDPNLYYIIYNGVFSTQGFYYALIDMSLNGGLGAVVQKNVPLIANTRMADCVKAIRHGNGRDWWVMVHLSSNPPTLYNRFFVFLISPSGITTPIVQDFGNAHDGDYNRLVFNSDGSKLMHVNTWGVMIEYNFDRCTGIISNPNIIYPEQTSNFRLFWEPAYSPNDSLLYLTTIWYDSLTQPMYLFQYDLFAPNIPASCDTLFVAQVPITPGAVRLAPDNKIYLSCFYDCWCFQQIPYLDSVRNYVNENLSVIENPNLYGAACNFSPFSFNLGGKRTYSGLPNNPNYNLGSLIGSPCDTLTTNIHELQFNSELFVFYNAGWETVFINGKDLKGKNYSLSIFDLIGHEIYNEEGKVSSYFTSDLSCSVLANGIYIVTLETEKEKLIKRFVKN